MARMRAQPYPLAIERACEDLKNRTLARLDGEFAKLVYLASTRDYNTGRYSHDGLALRFTAGVAERALETEHRNVFAALTQSPLSIFVHQLLKYMQAGTAGHRDIARAWNGLEAYRLLPPAQSDALMVRLFLSNIRIALAIAGEAARAVPPEQ